MYKTHSAHIRAPYFNSQRYVVEVAAMAFSNVALAWLTDMDELDDELIGYPALSYLRDEHEACVAGLHRAVLADRGLIESLSVKDIEWLAGAWPELPAHIQDELRSILNTIDHERLARELEDLYR